mmetsp:Transcript_11328/g.21266  ORF Transcript_11328/g.21266 Transcript_11328/m.21266 type:complete len:187 (+) Transcript_11328:345-905(+)
MSNVITRRREKWGKCLAPSSSSPSSSTCRTRSTRSTRCRRLSSRVAGKVWAQPPNQEPSKQNMNKTKTKAAGEPAMFTEDKKDESVLEMAGAFVEDIKRLNRRVFESAEVAEVPKSTAVLPTGVSTPNEEPNLRKANRGWTRVAERVNSRYAMMGFFALLFVELVTGQGILDLFGIKTGNGLDIGF